jgi:hypothetical protein
MAEENAAEAYLVEGGVDPSFGSTEFRWARSFPVTDDRSIDYSSAPAGTVIGHNDHKIQSGVNVAGGSGNIGTGVFVIPTATRAGLSEETQVYDNGVIEMYIQGDSGGATR